MWCTLFLNYVQPPKIPSTISMSNTTLFIYVQLLTGQHDVSLIRQCLFINHSKWNHVPLRTTRGSPRTTGGMHTIV